MMAFAELSSRSLPLMLACGAILYYVCRSIYRITFHPLARFPGPKLAAITDFYAMFYDLPIHSSYLKELPALHDQYGPVVRAWPNILHIRDLDAYNEIFKPGSKYIKDPSFYRFALVEHSFFSITTQRDAKIRKDMFAPSFSRAAIFRLETMVKEKITLFLNKLGQNAITGSAADLNLAFSCLTADVVMYYCYGKTFGALDTVDFQFHPIQVIEDLFYTAAYTWYFPSLFIFLDRFTRSLPENLVSKYLPPVAATTWIQKQCRERVLQLKAARKNGSSDASTTPTIFDDALSPTGKTNHSIPSDDSLQDDACLMFVAGTDTTSNALVQATWHVLSSPPIYAKLKAELHAAIPDQEKPMLGWTVLENLPYLRGVVKEALRFSYGVPGRIPRVVPDGGANLGGKYIAAGTVVASAAYVYHTDDAVFSDAKSFKPERWVDEDTSKELEKRLLSFSKGPRGCLGINLAYAQIYLTLAHLLRYYDLELYETTAPDMVWDDCYTPKTRGHLKVTVKAAKDR